MTRKWLIVATVVALAAVVLVACNGQSESVVTTVYTAGDYFPLHADSSLVPSINPSAPEVCGSVPSDVGGRADICRLVWGYSQSAGRPHGDNREWTIQFLFGGKPGGGPPVQMDDGFYGKIITLNDGTTYEGCSWTAPDDKYNCDYMMTNQFVPTSGNELTRVLDKFWHWSHYELTSDIGCAAEGAAILAGKGKVTLPFLGDCSDGPYNGG